MAEVAPNVPVRGALCFVDSDMVPPLGKLSFKGFALTVKPLSKRINARRPIAAEQVRAAAAGLALRFPSA
jgi:hypothetical protein